MRICIHRNMYVLRPSAMLNIFPFFCQIHLTVELSSEGSPNMAYYNTI